MAGGGRWIDVQVHRISNSTTLEAGNRPTILSAAAAAAAANYTTLGRWGGLLLLRGHFLRRPLANDLPFAITLVMEHHIPTDPPDMRAESGESGSDGHQL